MIVASLYSLPLIVLKSSASASDAERSGKIASVVTQSFTRGAFCLFCSPHGNDKMMSDHKRGQLPAITTPRRCCVARFTGSLWNTFVLPNGTFFWHDTQRI